MRSLPFVVVFMCGLAAVQAAAEDAERPRPGPDAPAGRNPAEAFKRADADGDGKVSKAEFVKARSAETEQMFDRIDANRDGFLEPDEGRRFMESLRSGAGREGGPRPGGPRPEGPRAAGAPPEGSAARPGAAGMGAEMFKRFDGDGNGQLSQEEFEAGMMRLREMMQRNGMGQLPGRPAGPGGGPAEGFRRPPAPEGAPREEK
jgi:Ca2+-binding EF-hand superfamily protein